MQQSIKLDLFALSTSQCGRYVVDIFFTSNHDHRKAPLNVDFKNEESTVS